MTPRLVAIVPASGLSRRMGQPKLLLRLGKQTVISRVVETLIQAGVMRVLVVVRPDDDALAHEVRQTSAELIQPEVPPPDMRSSVEAALAVLIRESQPWAGWLLIPADHPTLDPASVHRLIDAWTESPNQIAVPTWEGHRGHPTVFPWSTAYEVSQLTSGAGLNLLLRSRPERVREIPANTAEVLTDLDTPEDWERVSQRWSEIWRNLPDDE